MNTPNSWNKTNSTIHWIPLMYWHKMTLSVSDRIQEEQQKVLAEDSEPNLQMKKMEAPLKCTQFTQHKLQFTGLNHNKKKFEKWDKSTTWQPYYLPLCADFKQKTKKNVPYQYKYVVLQIWHETWKCRPVKIKKKSSWKDQTHCNSMAKNAKNS